MVARAFCELFVAGCLEVEQEEIDGEVLRRYRISDGVDIALLGRVERVVARCLRSFRSFAELLRLTEGRAPAPRLPSLEAELLAEMGEVIDDALEYLPPSCSCSV